MVVLYLCTITNIARCQDEHCSIQDKDIQDESCTQPNTKPKKKRRGDKMAKYLSNYDENIATLNAQIEAEELKYKQEITDADHLEFQARFLKLYTVPNSAYKPILR